MAFQLAPVLRKGTYRLAKPGRSCFLQSCLYLLATALPETRQTLPLRSFEPINAAGSKARAPRGNFPPSTAALFAHATHFGGARGGVYSQNVILCRLGFFVCFFFSPVTLFHNSSDVSSCGIGKKAFPKAIAGGRIPQDGRLPPPPAALSAAEPGCAACRIGAHWELNRGDPISSPLL